MEKKFTSDEIPLSQILGEAKSGKLQLPDFQRGWVWDDQHITSLLASISVSFPIGAVMTLETGNPDVRFRPRPLEGVELTESVEPEILLLDGQQRTTSLFNALMSDKAIKTRDAKGKEIERRYYADINACIDEQIDRDEAIISVPGDGILKSFQNEVRLDLTSRENEVATEHFPLSIVLDQVESMQWFLNYLDNGPGESKDARQDKWQEFLAKVITPFTSYHVPEIRLVKSTPKEAVCQVFEKVNTGGVVLDVFELLTATYAADDYSLREDWDARRKRFVDHSALLESFDSTRLLQVVSLLASSERRRQHFAKGGEGERAPAVACKRKDVLRLELDAYKRWVDVASEAVEKMVAFLHNEHIFAARDIPYPTQLVPLAAIVAELGELAEGHPAKEKLRRWFWCGVFGELYGGSTETRFAFDLPEVVAWIRDDGDEPRTVRDAQFQADRLLSLKTRQSAAYKGIYAQQMKRGGRDFRTGDPIEIHSYYEDAIDVHHIFPRKWCESRPDYSPYVDSVVNRTAIDAKTNIQIGGNAPSVYLAKIEERDGLSSDDLDMILRSHDIDPVFLRADDFPSFFNARFERLVKQVEDAMGKPANRTALRDESPFSGTDEDEGFEARIEALISGAENSSVEFKSTGRINTHTGEKDARMEWEVVKTITGMMNAVGGTLLVGIDDDGNVVGIDQDFPTLGRKQDADGWCLWLTDLLESKTNRAVAAAAEVAVDSVGGREVAAIDVGPAAAPVFASGGPDGARDVFYVRVSNSTREMSGEEALKYQSTRWAQS